MREDLRLVLRSFRSHPVFFATTMLTLAVGIGVHAAVFSLVHDVLMRPLPFPDEQSLVALLARDRARGDEQLPISPADFFDVREQVTSLSHMSAFTGSELNVGLADGTRRVPGGTVTAGFFEGLGVKPLHGRIFRPEDFQPGSEPVLLLGRAFWQRYLGGDPSAVGRTMKVSGKHFRIVGVVPDEIRIGLPVEIWMRLAIDPAEASREARFLVTIGRLKPGTSIREVQAEVDVVAGRLARKFPESHSNVGLVVGPLRERLVREARPKLLALWGTAGFAFLLVCANAAFLFVVRVDRRQGELALRLALGASRWRVVRQILTESLSLACVSTLLGIALSRVAIEALRRLQPDALPGLDEASFGGASALFAAGLGSLVGLAVGLTAMARLPGRSLGAPLTGANRLSSGGAGSLRLQTTLIVIEVALALVLLDGAVLMVRSLRNLTSVDPGFDVSGVLTVSAVFPSIQYPPGSPQLESFLRQGLESLAALPGIERAASGILEPFGGAIQNPVTVEGEDRAGSHGSATLRIAEQPVSGGYFETMGVELLRGQTFREGESSRVALINQTFAEQLFAGQEPLGRWLRVQTSVAPAPLRLEVIGVVESERQIALAEDPVPTVYLPHSLELMPFATFFIRTAGLSVVSLEEVRRALQTIDPDVAVDEAKPIEAALAASIADQRTLARLLGVSSLLALFLAAVGVYGVTSLAVGRHTRDMGIRLSLGATPRRVLREVLVRSLGLISVGIALGIAVAMVLTQWLADLLFRVDRADPLTFSTVILLVVAASLVAAYVPARRASQVDPVISLRQE